VSGRDPPRGGRGPTLKRSLLLIHASEADKGLRYIPVMCNFFELKGLYSFCIVSHLGDLDRAEGKINLKKDKDVLTSVLKNVRAELSLWRILEVEPSFEQAFRGYFCNNNLRCLQR